jgi:hypothetical protein
MRDVTHSKDHPRNEDWDKQTIRHRCTSVGVSRNKSEWCELCKVPVSVAQAVFVIIRAAM